MIREITPAHLQHIVAPDDETAFARATSRVYDVCVVGSGPGGSVAAATLAAAGCSVVLLERGAYHPPDAFTFRPLDMATRLGHLALTRGNRTALYQGQGVGGSSLIFGAVAMRPPSFIFDDWSRISGVRWSDAALEPHYAHVGDLMSVTRQSPERENRGNAIVREMAAALGVPDGLEIVRRYTRGCAGVGLCNFGCGFNLKGTMTNSVLPDALETGRLTVLTGCEATEVLGQTATANTFHADGVAVTRRDVYGGRVFGRHVVRARHVILAAGAFFSSALLLRSRGLPAAVRARIGRKIYLQPHAQVFGLFDRPVTQHGVIDGDRYLPYHGVPAIYNFTGMLHTHGFFWLASILFPANLATFVSHLPPEEHETIVRQFHHTTSVTLTIRDDPARARIVVNDGKPVLDFQESRQDLERLRAAMLAAARGFLRVGARRVFLPLLDPPRIECEADLRALETRRFGYDEVLLYSDHTSGGTPTGSDATRGAADEYGRLFGTANVSVADASVFPSACGVNPSWTIMALAHRAATHLSDRLGGPPGETRAATLARQVGMTMAPATTEAR